MRQHRNRCLNVRAFSTTTTSRRGARTATTAVLRTFITLQIRASRRSNMPVFSLNSRVHVWPGRAEVIAGLRAWVERLRAAHPELVRIGYFGSLTDGVRYGFGSDADVVAVVTQSPREHWWERA